MTDTKNRPLCVFLCHASDDKPAVRELYRQLIAEGWLDVWLDEEKLLPGQEWNIEIEKAVEQADVVVACLSNRSVDKEGYVQKELRIVLNLADEKPEGTIFVIPLKLEECTVPRRLRTWQWVDYFPRDRRARAYQRLMDSLKLRAARLGISTVNPAEEARRETEEHARKEAQEKNRKDEEVQERNAAQELALKQAEDLARWEQEAHQRNAAEEQIGKMTEKAQFEKNVVQPVEEKNHLSPSFSRSGKKPVRHSGFIFFGIAAVGVFVLTCGVIGVNYIIRNWPATNTPLPIDRTPVVVSTDMFTTHLPIATPALGIGNTQVSEKDGMILVYVPAGEFSMGSNSGAGNEQPVHTVYLDAFWIDRTEVTNKMYTLCVAAGKCDPPYVNWSRTRQDYYGNPQYDDFPVMYVAWNYASAYCSWAGRRLPTEAEWEKAASWDEINQVKRMFPWGDTIDCTFANYSDGNKECTGDTTKVGNYPSGASSYGALDMAGNVSEWVVDWFDAGYYSTLYHGIRNPTGPSSGDYRVIRGGSWNKFTSNAGAAVRSGTNAAYSLDFLGFRCSRSDGN